MPKKIPRCNSTRRQELSMIKEIKELTSELQIKSLGDWVVSFSQSKVPVVDSRPVEKSSTRITPFKSHSGGRERRRIEILASIWGFADSPITSGAPPWSGVSTRKNDRTAKAGAQQRVIVRFNQRHRKSRREPRDSANAPSVRQLLRSRQFIDWEKGRSCSWRRNCGCCRTRTVRGSIGDSRD